MPANIWTFCSSQVMLTARWTSPDLMLSWSVAIQSRITTTAAWRCSAAPPAPPLPPFPPWTKAAVTADSLAALAARVSTATRTPTSGTRGASSKRPDGRLPSSGPWARGPGARSSRSWTRSWRRLPGPCYTSLVYGAAQKGPNALSRAQNFTGNESPLAPPKDSGPCET